MSDFSVPVVRLGAIVKHPNADSLSITEVEGCPVIIRTGDMKEGDLAVYLPVESIIPENRDWVKNFCSHLKFKGGFHRLRAVRLRKVFSMGMLVPIAVLGNNEEPVDPVGQDVSAFLGVTKYEDPEDYVAPPPPPKTPWKRFKAWLFKKLGLTKKPERRLMPIYEVLHYRKSKHLLVPGEEVVATEKIHGCNTALVFTKGQLMVSSHRVLRKVEDDSIWWRVARENNLAEKLATFPDLAFYGEIYGKTVQDMEYGLPPGKLGLRFFDILDLKTGEYFSYDGLNRALTNLGLLSVPEVYRGPYDPSIVEGLADGTSLIASHFREGIVIRPTTERKTSGGRVVLKLVGETYLLRKDGTEKH